MWGRFKLDRSDWRWSEDRAIEAGKASGCELTIALANRFPQLMMKDVDVSVKEILDKISDTLVSGHRVEIRGFGTFSLNFRPPRTGRNPKTGSQVAVPAKYTPHFKAGKELRERVDQVVSLALRKAA